jgi:DNA repair protein RadA/Sms
VPGSKPLLVEVQSLVTSSRPYGGRRAAEGVSLPRLHILLAVLEKRLGYSFVTREVSPG